MGKSGNQHDGSDVGAGIRETLEGFPAVVFATVFGSAAQNRLGPLSDVDVAVAAETPLDLETRGVLAVALSDRLHREVDLVDLQTADGLILQQALTGKVVKNDRPELFASLILKMWYHEADFMPIYRRMMAERTRRFLA